VAGHTLLKYRTVRPLSFRKGGPGELRLPVPSAESVSKLEVTAAESPIATPAPTRQPPRSSFVPGARSVAV
jgi:hypothetical protein